MLKYKNVEYKVADKIILADINVTFKLNKITAIIGQNGSGKSSLIKLLSLTPKDYSGEITYNDRNINNSILKNDISILLQNNTIADHVTVLEFMRLSIIAKHGIFKKLPTNWFNEVELVLSKCGCKHLIDSRVNTLSGGEKQRVLIAAALIKEPQLLILDEPLTYLDVKYQAEILNLLKELNEKHQITIIIVIHDINQAIFLADNIVLIKNGKVLDHIKNVEVTGPILSNLFEIEFKQHYNHFIVNQQ